MVYPDYLLPQNYYKKIDSDLSDLCLLRHSHLPQEELLDNIGKLKNEVIAVGGLEKFPDYSTILFGVYNVEDIKLKIINDDYNDYCKPNTVVKAPSYKKDFIVDDSRGFWSVMIEKINNKKIKYNNDEFSATCHIFHTPTKSNFWHFSIHWYIEDIMGYWHENKEFQTVSIRKKLKSEVRGLFKQYGKPFIVSDNIIDAVHYKDS